MKTIEEEFPAADDTLPAAMIARAYNDLRARAVEMEKALQWMPLSDAPSSSPCLVTDGETVEKARWMPRLNQWRFPHAKLRITPTHWQPLPPPPNHQQTK